MKQLGKMKPNLRLTSLIFVIEYNDLFWRGSNVNGQRRVVKTMDENEELSMKI